MENKIQSPCVKCRRKDEDKNDYSCLMCPARTDFALATMGDEDAFERYLNFNYPDIGKLITEIKEITERVSRRGRKAVTEEYYQRQYFETVGVMANKKYNMNFNTIKDVLKFLYGKYKSQRYIADNYFNVSVTVIRNMLVLFGIKILSMSEVKKMECDRRLKKNEKWNKF